MTMMRGLELLEPEAGPPPSESNPGRGVEVFENVAKGTDVNVPELEPDLEGVGYVQFAAMYADVETSPAAGDLEGVQFVAMHANVETSPAAAFAGTVASRAAVVWVVITISALFALAKANNDWTMMTLPRKMRK